MDNKQELRACPFCGGKAELKMADVYMKDAPYVKCSQCGIHTSLVPSGRYMQYGGKKDVDVSANELTEKAIKAWNTRHC